MIKLSDSFFFVLNDGDQVWPSTVSGTFRISISGEGHNIVGKNEHPCTEQEMIHAVLNEGKGSRFRSKSNESRVKSANIFYANGPSVQSIHVNVGGVFVQLR